MRWREHAAPIITNVIKEYGHDQKLLKTKLREAYPYGERAYHPYKIWCDEIRRQLGTKKVKCKIVEQPGQGRLF
jgi:hypothetical protein